MTEDFGRVVVWAILIVMLAGSSVLLHATAPDQGGWIITGFWAVILAVLYPVVIRRWMRSRP